MEKALTTIAAIMCVLALNGCRTANRVYNEVKDAIDDQKSTSKATEKKYKIGETVKTEKWDITINNAKFVDKIIDNSRRFTPSEGNKYLVINLTVKNTGTKNDTFLSNINLITDDLTTHITYKDYNFSGISLIGYSEDLFEKSLNPLSSKNGVLTFEISSEVSDKLNEMSMIFKEGTKKYTINLNQTESAASSTTSNEQTAQ